jgi:hypothetical protein
VDFRPKNARRAHAQRTRLSSTTCGWRSPKEPKTHAQRTARPYGGRMVVSEELRQIHRGPAGARALVLRSQPDLDPGVGCRDAGAAIGRRAHRAGGLGLALARPPHRGRVLLRGFGEIAIKVEGQPWVSLGRAGSASVLLASHTGSESTVMPQHGCYSSPTARTSPSSSGRRAMSLNTHQLPEASPADVGRLKTAAARHQIEILGPPSMAGSERLVLEAPSGSGDKW